MLWFEKAIVSILAKVYSEWRVMRVLSSRFTLEIYLGLFEFAGKSVFLIREQWYHTWFLIFNARNFNNSSSEIQFEWGFNLYLHCILEGWRSQPQKQSDVHLDWLSLCTSECFCGKVHCKYFSTFVNKVQRNISCVINNVCKKVPIL